MKLPIATTLRAFVTKHGTQRIDTLRPIVQKIMFDCRAHHTSGEFGAQRQRLTIERIGKGVHFFFNDVGDLTDTARKQTRVLKDRGTHITVAISLQPITHDLFELLPARRGAGQGIIHTANRGDF